MLCGAAITTASSRQTPVALSTLEAEVYAPTLRTRAVLCARRLLSFMLGTSLPPTVVFEDPISLSAPPPIAAALAAAASRAAARWLRAQHHTNCTAAAAPPPPPSPVDLRASRLVHAINRLSRDAPLDQACLNMHHAHVMRQRLPPYAPCTEVAAPYHAPRTMH